MKKLMMLSVMAAGMAFLGTADTAQAGHDSCRSGFGSSRSYGFRSYSPRYYSSSYGNRGGSSHYRSRSYRHSGYGHRSYGSHRSYGHGGIHIRTRGFSFGLH
jgi:hypothetical protein